MTDEQRYEIASELLRTVTALQDAFSNAVTHAAVIR